MADDNSSRYRTTDPFSRAPASAAPASDPLAELARLIGQSDPFSGFGRETRPAAERDDGPRFGSVPAPRQYADEAPQQPYADEPAPPPYPDELPAHYADAPSQRYAGDYQPRFSDAPQPPSHDDWPGSSSSSAPLSPSPLSFLTDDPFDRSPQPQQAAPQQSHAPFDDQSYADPRDRLAADNYRPDHAGYEQQGYAPSQAQQDYSQPLYPHEPEGGSMRPPHDDRAYDEVPRGDRRRGMLTVAAVFALAVVGTAGAFGYRSLFGGPGSSSPPPVIRASGEPNKVAPPPATPDTSANKFSYDRFNDAGKNEQVVNREEKPVDIPKTGTVPRTVFPGAPVPNPSRPNTAAAANPPSAIGEPRRVRTVPIRPDQGDASANAPVAESMSAAPAQQAEAAAPSPRRSVASRTTSSVASRPAATPVAQGNAPLSLSPDAANQSAPAPSEPQSTRAPQRVASAPSSAGGSGSYLVQVSSQKSEADAQSSFRSIRSKYAGVLGNQPHIIRRADLGGKGVYYRAMVGPYGSREEAIRVCSSLKQAGGDCVVQH